MGQLEIYRNVTDNIKNEQWDAVWADSWIMPEGKLIRNCLQLIVEDDETVYLRDGLTPSIVQHAADRAFSGA